VASGAVRADEWEGAGGILVSEGERWGKRGLVIVDVALGTMWLTVVSCKKRVVAEGTD